MKIQIEVDERIAEEKVIIQCKELNEEVRKLQEVIKNMDTNREHIIFYQNEKEFFLPLDDILFFETDSKAISAHTKSEIYQVKYKLYELEERLPGHFMRVSKSTILNIDRIYAITRNLTGASLIEFQDTHKQVYVSRYYYKLLMNKLNEKRS